MLCVIARIDPGARERLAALRRRAEAFVGEMGELYGHITLAAYLGEEEERFIASCRELLAGYAAFPVRYGRIEPLPATSILVASLEPEGTLLSLHGELAERWSGSLDRWTGTELWRPHTTLLHDPEGDLEAAAAALGEGFTPFAARVERIEFSRVEEEGYTIVGSVELPEVCSSP